VTDTLTTKKLNLPKTSKYRPGMNLPINITTRNMARKETRDRNIPSYEKPVTRNMARKTPRENMMEKAMRKKARDNLDEESNEHEPQNREGTDQENSDSDTQEEYIDEIEDINHLGYETNNETDGVDTDTAINPCLENFNSPDNMDIMSDYEERENHTDNTTSDEEPIPPTQQPIKKKRKRRDQRKVRFHDTASEEDQENDIDSTPLTENAKNETTQEGNDSNQDNTSSDDENTRYNQNNEDTQHTQHSDYIIPETQYTQDNDSEDEEEHDIIQYTDVKTITHIISNGTLSLKQYREAQHLDNECENIMNNMSVHYKIIDNILFRNTKKGMKPVLPQSLYENIIFTKHYTIYGSHYSKARILRDTLRQYHVIGDKFEKKLHQITKNCYVCQMYNTTCPAERVKQLPIVNIPRTSWSIDMITDTPKSEQGNTQILLCVDDFTSFVVCIPVQAATTENILQALKTQLFAQFGIPKVIRSDQQSTFYTSYMFAKEFEKLGIELTATAVASPFSNARAESQIKNIKHLMRKFLYQEHLIYKWDEYLPILTTSHNKSIGIYGYSAEELMFGQRNPSPADILSIQENYDHNEFIDKVFRKAEDIRREGRKRMEAKAKLNRSYKNKTKTLKEFEIGALVLHKQLQASTGTASKYKPLYTGPYTILKLNTDGCTAILEHLQTGRMIKAHFTNMQHLHYSPAHLKLSDQHEETFHNMLQQKYTLNKYKDANTRYML